MQEGLMMVEEVERKEKKSKAKRKKDDKGLMKGLDLHLSERKDTLIVAP